MPSRTSTVRFSPCAVALELLDDAQRLLDVVEAVGHQLASTFSPAWPNGVWPRSWPITIASVSDLVEAERARHRARDLRDLERVGDARAVVIALGREEHLRLAGQPPERLEWMMRSRSCWKIGPHRDRAARARRAPCWRGSSGRTATGPSPRRPRAARGCCHRLLLRLTSAASCLGVAAVSRDGLTAPLRRSGLPRRSVAAARRASCLRAGAVAARSRFRRVAAPLVAARDARGRAAPRDACSASAKSILRRGTDADSTATST